MEEKSLQQHWNTICSSLDLALRGEFPLGLEALDAHLAIRQSLEVISKVLQSAGTKEEVK
jgi:hypothetical protein